MSLHRFPARRFASVSLAALIALAGTGAGATSLPVPLAGSARPVIEQFLRQQTVGLPGKVNISIDTPMSGALPHCEALEAFLPGGVRPWGRVSVGVRCSAGQPWTRYVPATIAVVGRYYVAARLINAGETLGSPDVLMREGDLTTLPASIIVDAAQLDGVTATNRIASGAPLRRELLRSVTVVHQGQSVKVISRGAGFVVSTEGKAMTDAAAGATVQVRIQGGPLLSTIVRADGSVERSP